MAQVSRTAGAPVAFKLGNDVNIWWAQSNPSLPPPPFLVGTGLRLLPKLGEEQSSYQQACLQVDYTQCYELGSVAGPVIQANGRLTFEDDLRSGGLQYFTTQ